MVRLYYSNTAAALIKDIVVVAMEKGHLTLYKMHEAQVVSFKTSDKIRMTRRRLAWPCVGMTRTNREMFQFFFFFNPYL